MKQFFVAMSLLLLAACVNTDYTGKSYPPTTSVDVYYSVGDVKRDFEVMGLITATALEGWDSDQMIEELRTQAMAKGADGLVIQGVHTDVIGSTTSTSGKSKSEPKWVVTEDGKLKDVSSSSDKYNEYSVTTETKEKVIDAELVKYQ
ncbi:hypothetical protein R0137_07955 [Congregibacter brevis]|uniref:Lipoprotein n=1 Tax=Congregibacter brevis TaxID=3081201 RepID=A0ABZ0IHJ7_9GAMM|nr:hypothetical protein R0137_07955 [Congregibacter sp. IMCC45268]